MKYSLIFVDLDGTLVGGADLISVRTLAALSAATRNGCTIVIATARNRFMVEPVAAQWQGHGYAILSNGAIIADWQTGAVIQKLTLPDQLTQQAVRIAHDFETAPLLFGVDADRDGGERVYTHRRFKPAPAYFARNRNRLSYVEDVANGAVLSPVGVGAYGSRIQMEALAAAWTQELGGEIAVFDSIDPKYDCWCAFLNHRSADKGAAAQRVAAMLGIDREEAIAIGDHRNDLGMLRWAGLGICMGDGHPDALAAADYVTKSLAEDGVADAIERFVLRDTPLAASTIIY